MKLGNLSIIFLTLALLGCGKVLKDPEDYYPELEMTKAVVNADGSVYLEGKVTSPGKFKGSQISHVGFCYNYIGNPEMLENQVPGSLNGDIISATIPSGKLDENATIFVRSFATNDFGYGISDQISFDSAFVIVNPPCNLTANYFSFGGNTGTYSSVSSGGFENDEFEASNGNERFKIRFPGAIRSGIFTTNSYESSPNLVLCTVRSGFNDFTVSNGQIVYVEKISSNQYKVTVCSAIVPISTFTTTYMGSFIVTL